MITLQPHEPTVKNFCPECGEESGDPNGWEYSDNPCPDLRECVQHLKGRLERVERALESHNFL